MGDELAAHALGFLAAGDGGDGVFGRGHGFEGAAQRAPIDEIGIGCAPALHALAAHVAPESHEAAGLGEGEGAEHDGIDHTEDGGIGADAEGEGERGDECEARAFAEAARGVAQILQQDFEPAEGPHFARGLLQGSGIAESAAGFGGGEVGARGTLGEVKLEFVFEVAIEPPTPEEGADTKAKRVQPLGVHAVCIMRATAPESRFQLADSSARCFLPAAVSL